jgi:hypothetical protein
MLGISILMKHRISSWARFQIPLFLFAPIAQEDKEMANLEPGELQYGLKRAEKSDWLPPNGPSCPGPQVLSRHSQDTLLEKLTQNDEI